MTAPDIPPFKKSILMTRRGPRGLICFTLIASHSEADFANHLKHRKICFSSRSF